MLPDILGYKLEEGIEILHNHGVDTNNIIFSEYKPPKPNIIGSEKRILKVYEDNGKTVLVVSSF